MEQTQSLPQVESAAFATNKPASNVDSERVTFEITGRAALQASETPSADLQVVSSGFFPALRVPLLQGRLFSEGDGAESPRVAVISQTMATRHWPNSSPLGQSLKLSGDDSSVVTIVGVVSNVKLNWYDPTPRPTIYVPYLQSPRSSMTLMARTRDGRQSAASAIRRQLLQIDSDVALNEIHPLTSEISDSLAPIRIIGWLMFIFGGVALILSTVGIYAMLSHGVARRTHEFGIRMAMGATSDDLLKQILVEAVRLAGLGLAVGLPVAVGLNFVAASRLFGLNGLNLLTLAVFTFGILLVALLAAVVPARRAMRSDPIVALRYQ